ncbi:MAG TPA: hypothetical protein PLP34_06435, partial [Chitinophagaceae bacterium]|nr:hypothetical protein [Chitinophagaceae bacterium]
MTLRFDQRSLNGTVHLPSSKSISNRLLLIRYLAGSDKPIFNLSEANDTVLLKRLLDQLNEAKNQVVLDCEDAGTVLRFLCASSCIEESRQVVLTGTARLMQRPMAGLINVLQALGASVEQKPDSIVIQGRTLKGGYAEIDASVSSQFISALCLMAPYMQDGLQLKLRGEPVSAPYLQMTLQLMQNHGIACNKIKDQILIPNSKYTLSDQLHVEADWSSASFFYAMALCHTNTAVFLHDLAASVLQGDALVAETLQNRGVISRYESNGIRITSEPIADEDWWNWDMKDTPDLAIPMLVAAALSNKKWTFSGLHHLAWKESDRLNALYSELQKAGSGIQHQHGVWRITQAVAPVNKQPLIQLKSHNDHRIVMALSMLCLKGYTVQFD